MAVEVDVAVNDPVLGPLRGVHLADLAGALRRRRGIDDGVGMGVAHPRKIDGRTRPQVDHRPLRHGAAELAARGVGEREVTGREHPAVIADPRGDGIVGVLHGLEIELDRHARKHPRVVVGIERIHAESLAVGVDARRVENRRTERRNRRPQGEIHLLRLDAIIIERFFCHRSRFFVFDRNKDRNFSYICFRNP